MTSITISDTDKLRTIVSTFTTDPACQAELVDMLANPVVREHGAAVRSIATVAPVQYTVRHIVPTPPQTP